MGEKFVNVRIQTADKVYPDFRKEFGVRGTPTVLFLDAQGGEIDRIVGYGGEKDEYFQKVQDYAAGKNTLLALMADFENKQDDVDANFALAEKYLDRYELDKAVPYFEKVLELDPVDSKGHKAEATYQVALNAARANQDVEPLKAFIAGNPDEKYLVNSYTTLASAYERKKEYDPMVATYEESLRKFPENARLMLFFSSSIFRAKLEDLYPKALELNEQCKTLDPEMEVSTAMNLITYYQNIGDKDKQIETFEALIAQESDSSGWMNYYASTILSQKIESHYDRGIEVAKKAIELSEDSSNNWYTLSQLYKAKGDKDKAIEAINKALEISPDNQRYQKALEELEGTN
jgi:tetratricopeptide (TPR) repeat protein